MRVSIVAGNLEGKKASFFSTHEMRKAKTAQHTWIFPVCCVNDFDGSFEHRNNLSLIEKTQKMVSFSPFIHLMVYLMRSSFL